MRRTITLRLKNLTKDDKVLLRFLCQHSAKVYNAALWCCRQHYTQKNKVPDDPRCQTCPNRHYFETPYYKFTEQSLTQLEYARCPTVICKKLTAFTRKKAIAQEDFLDHIAQTIGQEDMARYQELFLTYALKVYKRILSKNDIDYPCRWGDRTREHFLILGSSFAKYAVRQAAQDIAAYDELLRWYLDQHKLSSYLQLRRAKQQDPEKYKDAPRLPRYKPTDGTALFLLIAQKGNGFTIKDQTIYFDVPKEHKHYLPVNLQACLPLHVLIPTHTQKYLLHPERVKEVKIIPQHKGKEFKLHVGYEIDSQPGSLNPDRILGIDLGIRNLAACVDLYSKHSFLIDGKYLNFLTYFYIKKRKRLQWIQREQAKLPQYELTEQAITEAQEKIAEPTIIERLKQHQEETFITNTALFKTLALSQGQLACYGQKLLECVMTRRKLPQTYLMFRVTDKRSRQVDDYMKKAAWYILKYCKEKNIGKIAVGYNLGWKQGVSMGKRMNQRFTLIPYRVFLDALHDGAEYEGILYEEFEEGHTSKCSFLDYEEVRHHTTYSGQRLDKYKRPTKSGPFFRTANGKIVNADANAAANIAILGGAQITEREQFLQVLTQPKRVYIHEELKGMHRGMSYADP